jgi:hypothetical protein
MTSWETPGPAEVHPSTDDGAATREHQVREPAAVTIWAVVADDHHRSRDPCAERLGGLVAERLARLRGVDPSTANEALAGDVSDGWAGPPGGLGPPWRGKTYRVTHRRAASDGRRRQDARFGLANGTEMRGGSC